MNKRRGNDSLYYANCLASEQVDREHRDLLMFALTWLPYGWPPEDELIPRFGFGQQAFAERVRAAVAQNALHIDPVVASRLIAMVS